MATSKKKASRKKASKKKTSIKKKTTVKKKTPVKTKSIGQKSSDRNKEIEKKIKGATILGKLQMLKLNPKNIVVVEGFNPRIDKGDIQGLMASIKFHGVQQPIKVKKVGNHFELVDGHRRLEAALKLGLKDIPAIEVKGAKTQEELFTLALVHNDGKPFAPVEEADAYRRLISAGYSLKQISTATGKRVRIIKDRLALISAHPDVAKAVKSGKLSVNMGVAIAKKVKGKQAQRRTVKKAVKNKDAKKKVATAIGKANLKTKLENKIVDLQNRLNKLVPIVNKKRKPREKIPSTLVGQNTYFSRHKDKEIRAAFVAGGVYVLSDQLGMANAKKKTGKRKTKKKGSKKKTAKKK